jgi:PASTA domain
MHDDDGYEGRLRELLRDPGWFVPPRPDAQVRIERSARRQRITVTGLAACTGAAAVAAVAVPLALSGGGAQAPGGIQAAPAAAGHASATPSARRHPATIVMPDVTGKTLREAEAIILSVTTHGHITVLRIKATQIAGTVVLQSPAAGTRIATDGRITLAVPKTS